MTNRHQGEHSFSPGNVCERCGRTRLEVAKEGVSCGAPESNAGRPSPQRPRIVVLARPLDIVPATAPDARELGVLLVSAGDPSRVAAAVRAPASRFDPDEAFRVLDTQREWSNTVYGWVSESLAQEQVSTPIAECDPAPRQMPRWVLPAAASLVAVVHQLPEQTVLSTASAIYVGGITLLIIGLVLSAGAAGCVGAVVLFVFAFVLAFELGAEPWANLAFLDLFAISIVFGGVRVARAWRPWKKQLPGAPVEYVLEPGEALRYEPELCTVGTVAALSVAIQCIGPDGRVLRQVVLPLEGATRERAEAAARIALAPDEKLARERVAREVAEAERRVAEAEREVELAIQRQVQEEEACAARAEAAEALERVRELERSRRSLPDG